MNNSRSKEGKLNVVGSKIKYYRELNNLSYQKLSDKLMLLGIDIHKQAIYNIEKGIRTYSNQLKLDRYTTRTIDNTFMIDKVIRELYNRDWVLYSDNGTANDFNQVFINFIWHY